MGTSFFQRLIGWLWVPANRHSAVAEQSGQAVYLTEGMPDEPDTGDWDAICAAPSIEGFFRMLFREVTQQPMPDLTDQRYEEKDGERVRISWYGDRSLGIEVSIVEILESSMFDLRCGWETHGLGGIKVTWQYALELAGQLGHVAYRHGRLECRFASEKDQEQFAAVWRKAIGKEPKFAPASS